MVTLTSCLIWQIISFILPPNNYGCVYASISGPEDTEDADFGKKIIFSDEAHFNLGGYVNKQHCRIWGTENPHAYIEKSKHPKGVTVWCGAQMSKERSLQSMAIVIGPCRRNFCSQKLKRRILTTFDFNRTTLRTTQPKLHSMFCDLLLKIALSAAKLISFGHLGAAI